MFNISLSYVRQPIYEEENNQQKNNNNFILNEEFDKEIDSTINKQNENLNESNDIYFFNNEEDSHDIPNNQL